MSCDGSASDSILHESFLRLLACMFVIKSMTQLRKLPTPRALSTLGFCCRPLGFDFVL